MHMEKGDVIREQCNTCGSNVNQSVRDVVVNHGSEDVADYGGVSWGDRFTVLRCKGCDTVKIKHDNWFSEEVDGGGNEILHTRYYPPAMFRKKPEWFSSLDEDWHITKLFKEVYTALQNDCPSLAAMGLRAIFEAVMIDKIGDKGNFKNNLNAFESAGFISKTQLKILNSALEIGHASIHRAYIPAKKQILFIVDLAEGLTHQLYLLSEEAESSVENVPTRDFKTKL